MEIGLRRNVDRQGSDASSQQIKSTNNGLAGDSQRGHLPYKAGLDPAPCKVPPIVQKHRDPPYPSHNAVVPPPQLLVAVLALAPLPPPPLPHHRHLDHLLHHHRDPAPYKELRLPQRIPHLPPDDRPRGERMHKRAADEPADDFAHVGGLSLGLARELPFEPLPGPDAVDEEEAREEAVPAVGPEAADRGEGVDARGVERGEVGERGRGERGEDDGEEGVPEGEGRHEEGAQGGGEGELGGEGEGVERCWRGVWSRRLQVLGVDVADRGEGKAKRGEHVEDDAVDPVADAWGPCFLRVPHVCRCPEDSPKSISPFWASARN